MPAGQVTRLNIAQGLQADERASLIFRLRAKGVTSWAEICRQVKLSEPTARKIFWREVQRRQDERRELSGADLEQQLQGLYDDLRSLNGLLAQANAIDPATDQPMLPLKDRINHVAKLNAEKRKIEEAVRKLLGLDAPEKHAILMGQASSGLVLTDAQIDAMSVEEIDQALAEDARLRYAGMAALDVTVEAVGEEDPEPIDELPPEVADVVQDPGPHVVVPGDAASDEAEPQAEAEGAGDGG
jgi:hypothetical protein